MAETPETPPLGGTRWALVHLDGQAVVLEEGVREPYLELDLEASRLAGSGGVNRLVRSFELEGGELRLGPVGTTMMAGPETAMRREAAFVSALGRVTSYELDGFDPAPVRRRRGRRSLHGRREAARVRTAELARSLLRLALATKA